jgi:hypothetical protein
MALAIIFTGFTPAAAQDRSPASANVFLDQAAKGHDIRFEQGARRRSDPKPAGGDLYSEYERAQVLRGVQSRTGADQVAPGCVSLLSFPEGKGATFIRWSNVQHVEMFSSPYRGHNWIVVWHSSAEYWAWAIFFVEDDLMAPRILQAFGYLQENCGASTGF